MRVVVCKPVNFAQGDAKLWDIFRHVVAEDVTVDPHHWMWRPILGVTVSGSNADTALAFGFRERGGGPRCPSSSVRPTTGSSTSPSASNGQVLATSETYMAKQSARNAADLIRVYAATAAIIDQA